MISQATYEAVALEASDHPWELFNGELREKPAMSFAHNEVMSELGFELRSQLDRDAFVVRINAGRVARSDRNYFIPDVMVVPASFAVRLRQDMDTLEIYAEPLPLVVEVWSPSTGFYDVDDKLPEYQARGDLEIWRLHPYERTLTAWRRRTDGGYDESFQKGGVVHPVGLPNVAIDLDDLFDLG
jgi:Uma2 family endonuclease